MRIPPEQFIPEKPSNDRADIEVYGGYIEAAHERQVQIIFLMLSCLYISLLLGLPW